MSETQRYYRLGERIVLEPENVLEVIDGVVALTVLHEDGAEVLLGLCGAGQILAGHPEKSGCVELSAQTATTVQVEPWNEAVQRVGFADRLRNRLRSMEAWAAMQARPHIEQRLFGILSLLAEQFGRSTMDGLLIDVPITQAQLASAVGATRTTVSRLLSRRCRKGLIRTVRTGRGERYCLQSGIEKGTPAVEEEKREEPPVVSALWLSRA
jgi:CRP-like cAMP-binding protein